MKRKPRCVTSKRARVSIRACHWIMEALAAGYDGEALICDYAITALAAETGCTDADAMTAVTRAWHNLTPTRAI